ncbi:hypothetical protein SAMN05428949_0669 [Chitinophaga sp. YR627]|nr:hypothetical protein SAMN05428949_0669 [Chitinophaga sp. YR627]
MQSVFHGMSVDLFGITLKMFLKDFKVMLAILMFSEDS